METAASIVLKMNEMLDVDKFNRKEFEFLFNRLKELCKTEVKFLDFKYYSEFRLKRLNKEKINCIKVQDFEGAAKLRKVEEECQNYVSIRTEYGIEKSTFYHDQEYLFYFHLGTAKNDKKVKAYFQKRV
jgi:hypothetical protein